MGLTELLIISSKAISIMNDPQTSGIMVCIALALGLTMYFALGWPGFLVWAIIMVVVTIM